MKQFKLFLLFSIALSLNAQLRGKIVKIQDGDTVTLLDSDKIQHKKRILKEDIYNIGLVIGMLRRF